MIRGITWTRTQSVWNHSGLQRYPILQTSNWSGTFFAVSYSKAALVVLGTRCIFTFMGLHWASKEQSNAKYCQIRWHIFASITSFWTFSYLDHWSAKNDANAGSPMFMRRRQGENLRNAILKTELNAPSEIIQPHRKIFVQIQHMLDYFRKIFVRA